MKVRITTNSLMLWLCMLTLLLSQVLASCGGSAPTTPSGPVTINLWTYPGIPEVAAPPANWSLYKIVHDKLNINLKVSLTPVGEDGDTKMSAAAAANSLPDIFQLPTNAQLFLQWVKLGLIAPVDSLLPLMPQRTKDRYSDPTLNKLGTINGKLYSLNEGNPPTLAKRAGLFIRKDWLDKLGLPMPKTLSDFMNVAKAFTFDDPDGDGKNDTYGFGTFLDTTTAQPGIGNQFAPLYGAFGLPGAWNYKTPGKTSLSVRDPGYLQGTEFIKSLIDAKVVDPDWTTLKTNDFRARWKQGKYGIFFEDFCSAICPSNYQPFDQNLPNGDLVPLSPPTGPQGLSDTAGYSTMRFRMGISQKAINDGKGPAIAKLLEWLNSGEGYYLAGFGQNNVNYKLDAQGNIVTAGVPVPFTTKPAQPLIQIRNVVLKGSPPELAVRYPSFKTQNGRTIVPLQVLQQFSSMPWENITREAAIQPADNQADINRYIQENLVQFLTGQKTLDSNGWNAFVQGLDGLNVSDWESTTQSTLKSEGLLP